MDEEYGLKEIIRARDEGLNCIRLCNWVANHPEQWKLEATEPYIDKIVKWCKRYGLYVLLDCHTRYNTFDFDTAKRFWDLYAERYEDEDHVIYELMNEPQASAASELERLYDHVRAICPDKMFAILSSPNANGALRLIDDVEAKLPQASTGQKQFWGSMGMAEESLTSRF